MVTDESMLVKNNKTVTALVRMANRRTITELTTAPDKANNVGEPRIVVLSWDTSAKKQLLGAFKVAYIGCASECLFGNSKAICIKQLYYKVPIPPSTSTSNLEKAIVTASPDFRKVIHDPITQGRDLFIDLVCGVWGDGLLVLVYDFITQELTGRLFGHPLPFLIPQMRFVRSALAVDQAADAQQQTYLLEEVVDPKLDGRFRKYLNNNSAIPLKFKNPDDNNRAEFLAFSQHVQYWKTKKLVFVSDYQGLSPPSHS